MGEKKKKVILTLIISIATAILLLVGSTFAYFSATVNSEEGAVGMTAAVFTIDLENDTTLIKNQLIPSAEKYVDMSTIERIDANGDFIKPYTENNELIIEKTACIDDNQNEICSIYTFTVINTMTDMDLPLYITLEPAINTFENLYFKVLDEDKNIIMTKTKMESNLTNKDDNPDGTTGTNPPEETTKEDPRLGTIVLKDVNDVLPRATEDKETDEVIPSTVTYSVIMWIDETGTDQTIADSNQMFAATLNVFTSPEDGQGITGMFSTVGLE